MPHGTHDVSLLSLLVDGVAHGLAIDGQTLVLLTEGRIPLLQGEVEFDRIDPHQHIPDDGLAGNNALFISGVSI